MRMSAPKSQLISYFSSPISVTNTGTGPAFDAKVNELKKQKVHYFTLKWLVLRVGGRRSDGFK